MEKNYLYFHDKFDKSEEHVHPIERILYEERTPYQLLQLVESPVFGKMLIIDGDVQSSLKDEYIYHESIVHPAMLTINNPRTIFILGGGEGATAREVLKHRSVVKVVMIDIDKDAISIAKKYLKEWHNGSFDDQRLVLVHSDARKFMESEVSPSSVDVIISDLTEPFKEGPSYRLFTKEFYRLLYSELKDDGILALQSSALSVTNFKMHAAVKNTLQCIFPIVRSYMTYIPSFDTTWSFIIASKMSDPLSFSKEQVNELISNKIKGELKFYDGVAHVGIFSISKDLISLLSSVKDVITDEDLLTLPRKQ